MNVLILGSGGREHTFAWKLSQSTQNIRLFIAPGNAGTKKLGINLPISVTDFPSIKKVVLKYRIELVLVGPEIPLVAGIHDFFKADSELKEIPVVGPKKKGALLEGSKEFAKEFMKRHNIPTAKYQSFSKENIKEAYTFLEKLNPPYVLKADGLAAGKGVLIIENLEEAKQAIDEMLLQQKFGVASKIVVIEEFLKGIEMSCFALTDGKNYVVLPNAKDYKRIGEGDKGLNTGGMGAISPVPFAHEKLQKEIEETIIKRTITGLLKDQIDFQGFLFFGLMIVKEKAFVIEYNVRMGDPETEVVLPRIDSDFLALLLASTNGSIAEFDLKINPQATSTVMAVSGGYPETYKKGKEISGLNTISESIIFHAGTKEKEHKIITNGGRVLAVTSFGNSIEEALQKSYRSLKKLKFEDINYRTDIGFDL